MPENIKQLVVSIVVFSAVMMIALGVITALFSYLAAGEIIGPAWILGMIVLIVGYLLQLKKTD